MNHHAYVRHNLINTGLERCNFAITHRCQQPLCLIYPHAPFWLTCFLQNISSFLQNCHWMQDLSRSVFICLSRHDRWLKCTVGTAISYLLNCRQLSPDWIWERWFKVKWDAVFSARITRICCRLCATLSQLGSHHFRYGSSALIRLFAH